MPANPSRPVPAPGADPADSRVHLPLKPRPGLLAALSVVFALWVSFLVVLYFKTVYPRRSTAPRPDASGSVLEQDRPTITR